MLHVHRQFDVLAYWHTCTRTVHVHRLLLHVQLVVVVGSRKVVHNIYIDLPGSTYNCLSFFPFHSRWAPSLSTRERIFPHRFPCHVDSFSAFGNDWVVFVPTQPFGTTTAKMHRSFVGYFAPFCYCVPFFTGGKQLVNGFGIRFVLVLSKDGGSFIQYPFGFDRIVPSFPCSKYGAVQAQHSSSGYMYVAGHGLWYNKHSRHQLVQNNETPGLGRHDGTWLTFLHCDSEILRTQTLAPQIFAVPP